jgi:hypothetical protein
MSSFRASPWVTYEPTISYPNRQQHRPATEMDVDVDMDAPQISTLSEEATPPPASVKSKSKPGWSKSQGWSSKGPNVPPLHSGKSPHSPFTRDDHDEPEEEDQLIDDDDDDDALQPSATSSSRPAENRKLPAKKKARKGNKTIETGEKSKEKVPDLLGTQNLAPTMSCFKATPVESHEDAETATISQTKAPNDATPVKAKKNVSPRRPLSMLRAKTKSTKYVFKSSLCRVTLTLLVRQKNAIPPLLHDDMGALSESRCSYSSC